MGGPRFPIAMAAHMNEYFKPKLPVKPGHIVTGSGLTAIHEMIGWSLGDFGDGILVSRPVYGRFELDFGNTAGLRIVYADMDGVDPFASATVEKYQAALDESERNGIRTRALMIVNPHNPLGEQVLCPQNSNSELIFIPRPLLSSVYVASFDAVLPEKLNPLDQ